MAEGTAMMEKLSAAEVGAHDAAEEKSVAAAASTSDDGIRKKQRRHQRGGTCSIRLWSELRETGCMQSRVVGVVS